MYIASLKEALDEQDRRLMSAVTSTPIRVFIAHPHRTILWGIERLVESGRPAMEVIGTALNMPNLLERLPGAMADVVLLDIALCGEEGVECIRNIPLVSQAKVLMFSGATERARSHDAILNGARGIVDKEGQAEGVLTAIRKVHEGEFWLDHATTGRVFVEFSRKLTKQATDPEQRKIASLTDREREIIAVAATNAGATAREIATSLFVSENTVRNHLNSIYEKLGVANRVELFAYAHQRGLTKHTKRS